LSDAPSSLSVTPIPTRDVAIEIPWDSAMAKSRGIFGFDSMDARSRSFNMIRARLLELQAKRGWRMIGVVSATPSVGKSFISANVSAALSRDPRFQTYVVDLDLRRGSLSGFFGIVPERGVTDYLEGQGNGEAPSAYRLEGERLLIMPTTAGRIHSAEMLASERAQTLLRSMRVSSEKNLFIFDLPPVFANDDAVVISQKIDAYLMIVEDGVTTRKEVRDSFRLLSPAPCIGTVLNRYDAGLIGGDYGYGYGQNKRYGGYYDD